MTISDVAFSKAFFVRISSSLIPRRNISTTVAPARRQSSSLAGEMAFFAPKLFGKLMPSASSSAAAIGYCGNNTCCRTNWDRESRISQPLQIPHLGNLVRFACCADGFKDGNHVKFALLWIAGDAAGQNRAAPYTNTAGRFIRAMAISCTGHFFIRNRRWRRKPSMPAQPTTVSMEFGDDFAGDERIFHAFAAHRDAVRKS